MPGCLFKKCCFLIKLRIGCFIVGYLELAFSAIAAIAITTLIVFTKIYENKKFKRSGTLILAMDISFLLLSLGSFAFAIVLLIGLYEDKLEHLRCYLMYGLFYLIACVILLMWGVCVVKFEIWDYAKMLIDLLCRLYMLLIVRSYFYEVKAEEEEVTV